MIIVPEAQRVVILPPRTGTTALKAAIARIFPQSFLIYRHMEADGVPSGYDRWQRMGVVREPIDRLWSVYLYCKTLRSHFKSTWSEQRVFEMEEDTASGFREWLFHSTSVFATAYRPDGVFDNPRYMVGHPLPEPQKSQWIYLCPWLGTTIFPYAMGNGIDRLVRELMSVAGMDPVGYEQAPGLNLTPDYVKKAAAWELLQFLHSEEDMNQLSRLYPTLAWDAHAAGNWSIYQHATVREKYRETI